MTKATGRSWKPTSISTLKLTLRTAFARIALKDCSEGTSNNFDDDEACRLTYDRAGLMLAEELGRREETVPIILRPTMSGAVDLVSFLAH
jgi:hypothetical protein